MIVFLSVLTSILSAPALTQADPKRPVETIFFSTSSKKLRSETISSASKAGKSRGATKSYALKIHGPNWEVRRVDVPEERFAWYGGQLFVLAGNRLFIWNRCDPVQMPFVPKLGMNLPGLPVYRKIAGRPDVIGVIDPRFRPADGSIGYEYFSPMGTGNLRLKRSNGVEEFVRVTGESTTIETYKILRTTKHSGELESPEHWISDRMILQPEGFPAFTFISGKGTWLEQAQQAKAEKMSSRGGGGV